MNSDGSRIALYLYILDTQYCHTPHLMQHHLRRRVFHDVSSVGVGLCERPHRFCEREIEHLLLLV